MGDPSSPFAGAFPFPASPDGNPFVEPNHPDRPFVDRQVALGKALFWDEQLSSDNTMACGTCHAMTAGGTDGRPGKFAPNQKLGSAGMFPQDPAQEYFPEPSSVLSFFAQPGPAVNELKRATDFTAPTMVNAVFFEELFWRKRAGPSFDTTNTSGVPIPGFEDFAAPESLVAFPPVSPVEMGHDAISWGSGAIQAKLAEAFVLRLATPSTVPPDVQPLLGRPYGKHFEDIYGPDPSGNPVTRERIAMSIAHYMRTLVSDQAPVFLPQTQGGLTDKEVFAFEIMRSNGCFGCHSATGSPQFNNGFAGFQNKFDSLLSNGALLFINLPPPGDTVDDGMGNQVQANVKVTSLINLGLRNRFFHSGQIRDIDRLLAFYNQELPTQPAFVFNPPLDPSEKDAMRSLWVNGFTDPRLVSESFPFDRPDLYSERLTAMGPEENQLGQPNPGQTGRPNIISNPPLINGEAWFKSGVVRGRPGALSQFGLSPQFAGAGNPILIGPGGIVWSSPIVVGGNGFATWFQASQFATPGPQIIGTSWFGQWRIQDPTAAFGIATTQAARYVIH